MKSTVLRYVPFALLLTLTGSGCSTFFQTSYRISDTIRGRDGSSCSSCDGCSNCNDCCNNGSPRIYSEEWWAMKAQSPAGTRQKCKKGKLWPPYPRPTEKKQTFCHQFHTAHYWPHPYNCDDRQYVKDVCELQVGNGWMVGTTLFDYHFEEEDQAVLNHAGHNHLLWILRHAPVRRRAVWVQASLDREISDARLANVELAAAEMAGEAEPPPVMLRSDTANGRPAEEIDALRQLELNTMPEPRIIYQALPSGSEG